MSLSTAKHYSAQSGAVLIMALLIVALVAGLSIKFASDYQFGLARAEGRWYGAQARIYSLSAEAAALKVMEKDDPNFDHAEEVWGGGGDGQVNATEGTHFPLEGSGELILKIEDANSQFNLNSLLGAVLDPNRNPTDATVYTPNQRMFIRLLQTLRNPEDPVAAPLVPGPAEAVAILEAMLDWVDSDKTESGLGGAEENFYIGQPEPYKPSDVGSFRSVDELRMIKGITPLIMKQLRGYLTVLDASENMLNINTMLPVFYRCINTSADLLPLDEQRAMAFEKARPVSGNYVQQGDLDNTIATVFGASAQIDKQLTFKTNFFWVKTTLVMGDQIRASRSLLKRGQPAFKVIRREDILAY